MKARYLNRRENGIEEIFYPITHIDAVIGAVSQDMLDSEIVNVKALVPQLHPSYAAENDTLENALKWLIEHGDTTQPYVLPDWHIYVYAKTTNAGVAIPNFTNSLL